MKNQYKYFYLLVLITCMTMLNACKGKDPIKPVYQGKSPEPEFYKFELGEAKSYLWAQPGSYWIYKDSATGNLDTQTVTSLFFEIQIIKGTREETKHISVEFDKLRRTVYSSFHKRSYIDETRDPSPDESDFEPMFIIVVNRTGAGILTSFFHPFRIDQGTGTGVNNTFCKALTSLMIMQGKNYFQVARFDISKELTWNNNSPYATCKYYWAKDVGLIKKEVSKIIPENWELIAYNIVK